jgi:hypothetical protein
LTDGADCFLVSGGEAAGDVDGGSVLRVHDATLDFLRNKMYRGREEVRRIKVEGIGKRRGTGSHYGCRNRPATLADSRRSDEEFLGLGGVSGRRTKGRWRRVAGAFYSRDGALIRRGLNGINGRSNGGLGRVSGEIFGPRKKTMTWPWQVGPTRQRGREKESVPFWDTGWTVGLFWY